MTSKARYETDPARRALLHASAQLRAAHLRDQQVAREHERASMLEADAEKTARLRALRLAREDAKAQAGTTALKGVRVET